MKIGIYTIHACNNFGALLQAYATAKFLNDNGFEAELVNLVTTSDKTGMNYRHPWNNLKYAVYNLYAMANPAQYVEKFHGIKNFARCCLSQNHILRMRK